MAVLNVPVTGLMASSKRMALVFTVSLQSVIKSFKFYKLSDTLVLLLAEYSLVGENWFGFIMIKLLLVLVAVDN